MSRKKHSTIEYLNVRQNDYPINQKHGRATHAAYTAFWKSFYRNGWSDKAYVLLCGRRAKITRKYSFCDYIEPNYWE